MLDIQPIADPYHTSDQDLFAIEEVPLFPLERTVLLPGEPIPLHIYEERYQRMMESALSQSRLLALGHIHEKGPQRKESDPFIHKIAGLGRIVSDERLSDGRFNIVLLGLKRAKIEEILQEKPFTIVRVRVLPDQIPLVTGQTLSALHAEILYLSKRIVVLKSNQDLLGKDFSISKTFSPGPIELGSLSDFVSSLIPLSAMEKQLILEESNVIQRAEKLSMLLRAQVHSLNLGETPSTTLH